MMRWIMFCGNDSGSGPGSLDLLGLHDGTGVQRLVTRNNHHSSNLSNAIRFFGKQIRRRVDPKAMRGGAALPTVAG